MRMLLVCSAVALLFASCSNVESFRAPIEGLTAEWDSTTTVVTDFVNTLQSSQQNLQNQFAQMTVPEELTLNEESTAKVAELKDDYQEELASLSELSQTVSSFISGWQEKAATLTELKDGLAAGELGPETMETVDELKSTVSEAESGLENWQGELEDIKENTSDLVEQFNTLIANLQGS